MNANLAICMQLLLSMSCSNTSSDRAFNSIMKHIKIDKMNGLHNLTVSGFMRIKNQLKNQSFTASTAVINKDINATLKKVKTNVPINCTEYNKYTAKLEKKTDFYL